MVVAIAEMKINPLTCDYVYGEKILLKSHPLHIVFLKHVGVPGKYLVHEIIPR